MLLMHAFQECCKSALRDLYITFEACKSLKFLNVDFAQYNNFTIKIYLQYITTKMIRFYSDTLSFVFYFVIISV